VPPGSGRTNNGNSAAAERADLQWEEEEGALGVARAEAMHAEAPPAEETMGGGSFPEPTGTLPSFSAKYVDENRYGEEDDNGKRRPVPLQLEGYHPDPRSAGMKRRDAQVLPRE